MSKVTEKNRSKERKNDINGLEDRLVLIDHHRQRHH